MRGVCEGTGRGGRGETGGRGGGGGWGSANERAPTSWLPEIRRFITGEPDR